MRTSKLTIASVSAVLAFGLSACGGMSDNGEDNGSGGNKEEKQSSSNKENKKDSAMSEPFGPACSDVPNNGKGSFDGMAEDPVATAASNNPKLSSLTDAAKKADLVDTLNDAEDITVFAPANAAFEDVPKDDLDALMDDKDKLSDVLTYHVVEGKQKPSDLKDGNFTSLQGDDVTSSGSGKDFTINDEASVVCGNVQTSNATVYIIDSVLMPQG